ncbi:DMT family transporter [Thermophilibacter mediterraneus]|uniref:DMT family transporter n=1 Tax=Thermophilibacter mediterraneus TaxID=1871031 RepID=UPI000931C325|nr:DMT family transporter [Thermophilibacter mediterraneus]
MADRSGARGGRDADAVPQWAWKVALAACAAIWGGSFVVMKDTLDAIPPAWLMGIRFLVSALVVGALFRRALRDSLDASHLAAGAVLGVASGAAFVVQNVGLSDTTPGRNAFLTATYCVMVPFINWALTRRRPGGGSVAAALLAVVGVGLVALGDDLSPVMTGGDWLTLVAALLFAVHIVLVARFSSAHDVMTLTVVQLATSAALALVTAVVCEDPPDPAVFSSPDVWLSLAYLVLLSSCVCMVVQNLGQAHVPPAQASLLLSLESVFAVASSVIFYHEAVTPRVAAGFGTIFVAVLVSELGSRPARPRDAREGNGGQGEP